MRKCFFGFFLLIISQTIGFRASQMDGRTLNGHIQTSGGGVGRNLAEGLSRLGVTTQLISVVGRDSFGKIIEQTGFSKLDRNGLIYADRSAACVIVCDHKGDCRFLVGDMSCNNYMNVFNLRQFEQRLISSTLIIIDGNVPQQGIAYLMGLAENNNIPVFFEPTDHVKARVPFQIKNPYLTFMSPNKHEFIEIYNQVTNNRNNLKYDDNIDKLVEAAYYLAANYVSNIIVTLGADGALLVRKGFLGEPFFRLNENKLAVIRDKDTSVHHRLFTPPPFPPEKISNVSGAGDCFACAFVAGALACLPDEKCIEMGFKAATASLLSWSAVPENLQQFVYSR